MRNNWPSHSCLDLEQEEPEKHRATPKPLGAPSGDHFLTQPVGHTPSGPSQTLSSGGGCLWGALWTRLQHGLWTGSWKGLL